MDLIKDIFRARRKLRDLESYPGYEELYKKYVSSEKHNWFRYRYFSPNEDEYAITTHNHSEERGYLPDEMARTAAKRKIKLFVLSNHNYDGMFGDNLVIPFPFYGGIFVIKAVEHRCEEENGSRKDFIFIGHNNPIIPFRPIKETLEDAVREGAIIGATSPFNEGAKGLNEIQLLNFKKYLDFIEILNSSSGAGWLCYADIMAAKFAEDNNIPGIYANDAHVLGEIGLSGITVKKEYFPAIKKLDSAKSFPKSIPKDMQRQIIEELRAIIKERKFTNRGRYMPLFSVFYPAKFSTLSHKRSRPYLKDYNRWYSTRNGNGR